MCSHLHLTVHLPPDGIGGVGEVHVYAPRGGLDTPCPVLPRQQILKGVNWLHLSDDGEVSNEGGAICSAQHEAEQEPPCEQDLWRGNTTKLCKDVMRRGESLVLYLSRQMTDRRPITFLGPVRDLT